MSEDDTFKRLRKASFEEMQHLFVLIARHCKKNNIEYPSWTNLRNIAAKHNGWTVIEWQTENARRLRLIYNQS